MKPFPPSLDISNLDDCIKYLRAIGQLRQEDITENKTQNALLGRLRTDRIAPSSEAIAGGDALGDVVRDGDNYYVVVNTGSAYEWRQVPLLLPGEANSNQVSILNSNSTIIGNVGTGEDDLMTYTLPGGTLENNGDALEVFATGPMNGVSASKKIRFYFGSTSDLYINAASTANRWHTRLKIVRTGAATQVISGIFNYGLFTTSANHTYSAAAETLANDIIIKFTGESTTTDYIRQSFMQIKLERGV